MLRHHHSSVRSTGLETISNRPRWAGNLTPDPGPPGGRGVPASHSHQAHVFKCWRCSHSKGRNRQLKLSLTAIAPSKITCQQPPLPGPSTGAQGRQKSSSHLLLQSLAAQRHQDTYRSARQLHGTGPSTPIFWEASPCPACSMNTGEKWCRELQFLTALFDPAGSTNSPLWVCSLPNTLPCSS